jgi:hypothetical protein
MAQPPFRVEEGVEIPPLRRHHQGRWKRQIEHMGIGSSILLSVKDAHSFVSAILMAQRSGAEWARGIKLTRRKVVLNGKPLVRVWRITEQQGDNEGDNP